MYSSAGRWRVPRDTQMVAVLEGRCLGQEEHESSPHWNAARLDGFLGVDFSVDSLAGGVGAAVAEAAISAGLFNDESFAVSRVDDPDARSLSLLPVHNYRTIVLLRPEQPTRRAVVASAGVR